MKIKYKKQIFLIVLKKNKGVNIIFPFLKKYRILRCHVRPHVMSAPVIFKKALLHSHVRGFFTRIIILINI